MSRSLKKTLTPQINISFLLENILQRRQHLSVCHHCYKAWKTLPNSTAAAFKHISPYIYLNTKIKYKFLNSLAFRKHASLRFVDYGKNCGCPAVWFIYCPFRWWKNGYFKHVAEFSAIRKQLQITVWLAYTGLILAKYSVIVSTSCMNFHEGDAGSVTGECTPGNIPYISSSMD